MTMMQQEGKPIEIGEFTNLNFGNQRSAGEDEYLPTGNNIRDSVRPTV
jgi:hypothetical protein